MSKLPLPANLANIAQSIIEEYVLKASHEFKREFPLPTLSFRLRGKAAGKAYLQLNEIRVNPTLYLENQEAFKREVIPHEVAHLITFQVFGRVRPHGKEWQHVMANVFNIAPRTTHTFNISSVSKTFEYRCGCTTYPLSIHRHNKVQRGSNSYRCTTCHGGLTYTGIQLT